MKSHVSKKVRGSRLMVSGTTCGEALVYKKLKDGVEKLADVVKKMSNDSFIAMAQTSIGENTAVRKMKKDIQEMHEHFSSSFTLMDRIRTQTENKYKESKSEEARVQRFLRRVDIAVNRAASELEGAKIQLADSQEDYDTAKSHYDRAQASYATEIARHAAAQAEKDRWETACLATSWIPLVNIGTCLKYDAEIGDLNTAQQRLNDRTKDFKNKGRWLEEVNNMKEKLELKQRQLKLYQSQMKTKQHQLTEENKLLETKNRLYAQSVHHFQMLETEINVVFARSKETNEYTSSGTSMDSLIMRLQGVEEHLQTNQHLLRMDPKILTAISANLTRIKKSVDKMKEKNVSPDLWL